MAIVLTYDVDTNHDKIKSYLIDTFGYQKELPGFQQTTSQPCVVALPDTTLYHSTRTLNQGYDDIRDASALFNADLEKAFVALLSTPTSWLGKITKLLGIAS